MLTTAGCSRARERLAMLLWSAELPRNGDLALPLHRWRELVFGDSRSVLSSLQFKSAIDSAWRMDGGGTLNACPLRTTS